MAKTAKMAEETVYSCPDCIRAGFNKAILDTFFILAKEVKLIQ